MKKTIFISCLIFSCLILLTQCSQNTPEKEAATTEATVSDSAAKSVMAVQSDAERGRYLVTVGGCDDCHSPKIMTERGPVIDSSKRLSGHPADAKLAAIPQSELAPGKWVLGAQDLTAWVGLWGVSFTANLTPDTATGIGAWTPELFVKILRSGKHMGIESGRPILPPMPWENLKQLHDEDLLAIFAFLKTLPPVSNKVPEPLPPAPAKNS
jgi:cytochrome c553